MTGRDWPNAPPTPIAKAPTPAPTAPIPLPKCYPETAKVYFLPAPPSSPKITILDPKLKDPAPNLFQKAQEKPINIFKEVPATSTSPPKNEMSNRVALPPPPPCPIGLPDLIDDIPSKVQERISRLAESEEKPPACESCAALIKKLPIFNFDQELLNGFLAGIGI